MKYGITIEKVNNGYIITNANNTVDGYEEITVFEETESDDGQLQAGLHLLWHLINFFGLQGSKHDKVRLKAILEHQE